jgi:HPt (histidine-containing phosphotransfer) domain-containing protein
MHFNWNNSHLVDWQASLIVTGGSEELADELLSMFIKSLPEELEKLELSFDAADFVALKQQAHRIHGALCYCAIPALKEKIKLLEKESSNTPPDVEKITVYFQQSRQLMTELLAEKLVC